MDLPGDVRLYAVTEQDVGEEAREVLSQEERKRLASFRHPARRKSFVLGRYSARVLVGDVLGLSPEEVPLTLSPEGAVDIAGHSLNLSIAHSGARAVAVVSPRRVGVDIEQRRAVHPGLLDRILSDAEKEQLHVTSDGERWALPCWTMKEALLKGTRSGLRRPLRSIELCYHRAGRASVRLEGISWIIYYEMQDDYHLALAVAAP